MKLATNNKYVDFSHILNIFNKLYNRLKNWKG